MSKQSGSKPKGSKAGGAAAPRGGPGTASTAAKPAAERDIGGSTPPGGSAAGAESSSAAPPAAADAPAAAPSAAPTAPSESVVRLTVPLVRAGFVRGTVVPGGSLGRVFVHAPNAKSNRGAIAIADDAQATGVRVISVGIGDCDFFPSVLVVPEDDPKGTAKLIGVARGAFVPEGLIVALPFSIEHQSAELSMIARQLLSNRVQGVSCPVWAQRWTICPDRLGQACRMRLAPGGIGEDVAPRMVLDNLRELHRVVVDASNQNVIDFPDLKHEGDLARLE